ncbi:hypothetical protein HPB52_013727 [Rhipicephalus sanguineus]|uniref:SWIM-type domain-containing protein n=1 Tax=Rhipicephalus sanguineus TaxID=34632 RepID=A0A9D4PJE9_RHISA|nr:hypothetical protein HPB52_013727 [Rhipicephalus sanguineus]
MAPVVLRYGFSKITWPEDHFRRKALENGAKLCKARYAYDVEEAVPCRDSDTQVTAKCHSQVHQTSYNVTLQLSSQRVISGATCSCKAGSDGACKHVAAVALELNNLADATSSTDVPQVWGRPASKPNTSKKESVEELFGGITMEPMARKVFEKKVGTRVTQVGLVIHPQQPWLCASPDGLFHTSKGITLLEIKCPYSRKDDVIIDPDLCESFISYVVYEDGCLKLTRSHPYYCQVQVAIVPKTLWKILDAVVS